MNRVAIAALCALLAGPALAAGHQGFQLFRRLSVIRDHRLGEGLGLVVTSSIRGLATNLRQLASTSVSVATR